MKKNITPVKNQWLTTLLATFVGFPLVAVLLICAYGSIMWFGQMLFWGPPT